MLKSIVIILGIIALAAIIAGVCLLVAYANSHKEKSAHEAADDRRARSEFLKQQKEKTLPYVHPGAETGVMPSAYANCLLVINDKVERIRNITDDESIKEQLNTWDEAVAVLTDKYIELRAANIRDANMNGAMQEIENVIFDLPDELDNMLSDLTKGEH